MEETQDTLMSGSTDSLVRAVTDNAMANWSEEKRKDFAKLFEERSQAARWILWATGQVILELAQNRRYISIKHIQEMRSDPMSQRNPYYATAPGRSRNDLQAIAEDRAKVILAELPPVRKALEIIDPKTARKIDKRDLLLERGKALRKDLEPFEKTIAMADLDQEMTIGAFRTMVKERDKARRGIISELNDIAEEGCELERAINTALYEGLPGLSEAVMKTASDHFERAIALEETTRRVTERIVFGDSQAALDLLKHFEKDEVHVSSEIKAEFAGALEKLKIAKKQLRAAKKPS